MATPSPDQLSQESMKICSRISRIMRQTSQSVATAESLTSGSISCHLGTSERSSEWFLGGVIAYDSEVKFSLLGVARGRVISASCAQQMANGIAELTRADYAVAVTGAGGPAPEKDQPAGTVFIAVHTSRETVVEEHHFPGRPSDVVQKTTLHALQMLDAAARVPPPVNESADCPAHSVRNRHQGEPL